MKPIRSLFLILALMTFSAHANSLHDNLALFFTLDPQDSVVALEQMDSTTLKITIADPATGKTRTLSENVGSQPMKKLLIKSNDMGLKTIYSTTPDGNAVETATLSPAPSNPQETPPAQTLKAEAPGKSPRSVSSQRKNRMSYIWTQTFLSTYVYGVAIPNAYDASPKLRVATPLIIAPLAFGGNFYFAKNRPFEDSHFKGTTYLSGAALYASHAIPFSLMDEDEEPYKVSSFMSMAGYPLGVWAGYKLGDKYVDLPGRIDTQQKFALGFGVLGFLSPFLYYEEFEKNNEAILRLGLGQSVVLATAGHFMADHYRSGENIPEGVNSGILHHTALGATLGLEVAALSDASTARPWLGAALLGGTLGFLEGLYYYRDSYDSKERGLYNSLGMGAGALMGAGILLLAFDEEASEHKQKITVTTSLVGGAWLGYWITNFLTEGMEDRNVRGAHQAESWVDRLAVNILPIPMPERVAENARDQTRHSEPGSELTQDKGDRKVSWRYHIPGLTYRF